MVGIVKLAEIFVCRQTEQGCQAYGGQIICYFSEMVIFSNELIATVFSVSGGNCCFTAVMNHLGWGGFRYVSHICCCMDFICSAQMPPVFLGDFRKRLLARDTLHLFTCHCSGTVVGEGIRLQVWFLEGKLRKSSYPLQNQKMNFSPKRLLEPKFCHWALCCDLGLY